MITTIAFAIIIITMYKCLAWSCKEEVEGFAEDQICPFWKSKGVYDLLCYTRIQVALQALNYSWRPSGPIDFSPFGLRLCDSRLCYNVTMLQAKPATTFR